MTRLCSDDSYLVSRQMCFKMELTVYLQYGDGAVINHFAVDDKRQNVYEPNEKICSFNVDSAF